VDKLRQTVERAFQDEFTAASQQLKQAAATAEFLPTETEVIEALRCKYLELQVSFRENVDAKLGEVTPDMRDAVVSTTLTDIENYSAHMLAQLSTTYAAVFSQWLLRARLQAERQMEAEFASLFPNGKDVFSDFALKDRFSMILRDAR
jgi:Zn-dependent M16 (insulinase) family peptidase